jgi:hypothetical protein
MQQVMKDQLDVGRIMTQLLQLHHEQVAIENFNNILPLVSSQSRIALMTWLDEERSKM